MFGNIFNQKKTKDDESSQVPSQDGQPGATTQNPNQVAAPVEQGSPQSSDPQVTAPDGNQTSQPNQSGTPVNGQTTDAMAPGQPSSELPPQSPGAGDPTAQSGQAPVAGQPGQTTAQPGQSAATGPNAQAGGAATKAADMSALSHLDARATQVLTRAQEETRRIKQQFIEPDQILIGLLYDEQIYKLLQDSQVDGGQLSKEIQAKEKMGTYKGQPTLSNVSQKLFDQAYKDAKMRSSNFVSPEDLFVASFTPEYSSAAYLQAHGLKKEKMVETLSKNPSMNYARKTILEKYGIDLTEEARAGRLDPIAGREKEIDRITHILLRRTKNNPIIIGETGVGKTAIVEGLAQAIVSGKVPKDLQDKRIFQLDVASLVAGASHRGEFEERLRGVINEVLGANNKIILFIDEIHALMGTGEGEGMNAANIIKPHLARGHFQLIGATTTTEYRKNFEKDKAFERRFQPVTAEEPSEENAVAMLKIIRPKYEKFHRVTLTDDTLKECVKLSKKYIGERYLPDKAIDLLDEASSHVKLQSDSGKRGDTQVKKSDIEAIVSAWTGIPITKLTEDESKKLLKLEDRIHNRMVDQEEAVVAVSEAVRRGRIGLASGQRPIASFIFLGPTGVGKTELAKTLAELLFGKDDAMARLDMSEYMEKHEVAKLIGAPPGYVGYEEGGVLTEAVRKKPYCIVLMDEIEKAHPDVFNILLQLLEDGRLTDNKGNTISFKNTIVICTSNIGSSLIMQHLNAMDPNAKPTAEQLNKQFKELDKIIRDELTKFLRPEVLNRFDEVVIFKPLRPEHMAGIVRLGIAKTAGLLKEQGYGLQITEKAIAKLAKDGYDPVYGARPLRRLIQTVIENPIALAIISKKFSPGDTIVIDYNDDANEFVFLKGGQVAAKTPLNDEQFKVILQQIANPETATNETDKATYVQLHDKVVKASTGGDKTYSAILSVTAATSSSEVKTIRAELDAAKEKGDELAKEILAIAEVIAQQLEATDRLKKALLQLVNPTLAMPEQKEEFTQMHDKLTEASQNGNSLAAAILAVTATTAPDAIQKLMDDLKHGKDEDDELATAIFALINTEVTAEAEKARESEPTAKYKKIFQELLNPLYLADPENKAKFSQLHDKISDADKQNHPLAASILAITDITSDDDIKNLKEGLEKAKEQGDPLAAEILETIEAEIKHEQVKALKDLLVLVVNPIAAKTPIERQQYTDLREKISQAGDQNNALAAAVLAISDATTDDDMLKVKEQIEQGKEKGDPVAVLISETLSPTPHDETTASSEGTPPQQQGQEGQASPQPNPDQTYPFGMGQTDQPAAPAQTPVPTDATQMPVSTPVVPQQQQPISQVPSPVVPGVIPQQGPAAPTYPPQPPQGGGAALPITQGNPPVAQAGYYQQPVSAPVVPQQQQPIMSPPIQSGGASIPPAPNQMYGSGMAALNAYISDGVGVSVAPDGSPLEPNGQS